MQPPSTPRRQRRLPQLAFLALALVVPLVARDATAQQCADEQARKVFEAGRGFYETGYYEDALRSFKRAYELCPKAGLLRNMGATHERMGNIAAAIESYEAYLRADPAAEDKDATAILVANLRRRLAASAASASASASAAPPPPPPRASTSATAPPPPPPAAPAAQPDRLPAYIVLGVSGAFGIGALVTGLVAKGKYDDAKDSCSPSCRDSEVSSIKTMAWVSTAMTGVFVIGAGVGTWMLFSAKEPAPEKASFVPRASAWALPGGGAASATFRF